MDFVGNLFDIRDKVAIITGGGGLLCGTMAQALGRAGAKVVVVDIRLNKAKAIADQVNAENGNAVAMEADVTPKSQFQNITNLAIEKHGRIDILINGAGINAPTPLLDIEEEEFGQIIKSHLQSTLFGCQTVGKVMLNQKSGSIINISSASANPPLSKAFTYSAAKAAVKNLTQNIAREWGTTGVRVNAIRPGFFPTEWSRKNFISAERENAILGHTPMKRYGEAKELVGAIIWLSSDASSFVTGSEVAIDGGFSSMTI
mgnify:FL=1